MSNLPSNFKVLYKKSIVYPYNLQRITIRKIYSLNSMHQEFELLLPLLINILMFIKILISKNCKNDYYFRNNPGMQQAEARRFHLLVYGVR